jgi:hypothetical protein
MSRVITNVPNDPYVRWIEQQLAKTFADPGMVIVTSQELSFEALCDRFDLDYEREMSRLRLSRQPQWDEESI